MCGRTAYSSRSIDTAAAAFESRSFANGNPPPSSQVQSRIVVRHAPSEVTSRPNAGPGSSMQIFRRSVKDGRATGSIELCNGVWGLIPNNGSHHAPHPLPSDPKFSSSPHYKMFNARSETVYDKRSFSGLIRNGQTCILAVDGYYEWTKSSLSSSSSDKRKQPYFVCNNNKSLPLLLAGIWSCVKTGRQAHESEELEDLTTFTILTMDSPPDRQWLHPRQPVLIRDISIALEWLLHSSPMVLKQILRSTPSNNDGNNTDKTQEQELVVYPVSKIINDGKYQGADCTVEVKLAETVLPSLKSYFSPKKAKIDTTVAKSSPRRSSQAVTREESLHHTPIAPSIHSHSSPKKVDMEEKEVVEGRSGPELVSSKPARSIISAAKPKGEIMEEEQSRSQSPYKVTARTTEPSSLVTSSEENVTWACTQCTYIHVGEIKYNYLACEACGSPRIYHP